MHAGLVVVGHDSQLPWRASLAPPPLFCRRQRAMVGGTAPAPAPSHLTGARSAGRNRRRADGAGADSLRGLAPAVLQPPAVSALTARVPRRRALGCIRGRACVCVRTPEGVPCSLRRWPHCHMLHGRSPAPPSSMAPRRLCLHRPDTLFLTNPPAATPRRRPPPPANAGAPTCSSRTAPCGTPSRSPNTRRCPPGAAPSRASSARRPCASSRAGSRAGRPAGMALT
jgi:hypothetical protein